MQNRGLTTFSDALTIEHLFNKCLHSIDDFAITSIRVMRQLGPTTRDVVKKYITQLTIDLNWGREAQVHLAKVANFLTSVNLDKLTIVVASGEHKGVRRMCSCPTVRAETLTKPWCGTCTVNLLVVFTICTHVFVSAPASLRSHCRIVKFPDPVHSQQWRACHHACMHICFSSGEHAIMRACIHVSAVASLPSSMHAYIFQQWRVCHHARMHTCFSSRTRNQSTHMHWWWVCANTYSGSFT